MFVAKYWVVYAVMYDNRLKIKIYFVQIMDESSKTLSRWN